jgi:hypothetical protein
MQLNIWTENGKILLYQEWETGEAVASIEITADQVSEVVAALQSARDELKGVSGRTRRD